MFRKTGLPLYGNLTAGLQHSRHPARSAPAHHARMAAMGRREHLDDRSRFAMRTHSNDTAFVPPFHDLTIDTPGRAWQASVAGKALFAKERQPRRIFDINHPKIRVAATFALQKGVYLALVAFGVFVLLLVVIMLYVWRTGLLEEVTQ